MIAPSQNAPQTTVPKDSPQHRTIYDASGFEVFAKHFLAGFSQALGMILVYVLFLVIAYFMVIRYLLPTVQPYLNMYQQSMQSLQSIQSTFAPSGYVVPAEESGVPTESAQGASMTVTPEQLQQAQQLLQQMQQNSN
jgi:hypothetical protein